MRSDGRGAARPYATTTTTTTTRGRDGDRERNRSHEYGDGKELFLAPPFLPSCTQDAPSGYLPYHWLEIAETLLAHAADDIPGAPEVRALLRDLQEVRAAKMRASTQYLEEGEGVLNLRGVGAMELAASRGFVLGVVDGVRRLGASVEAGRREEELNRGDGDDGDDNDDDMEL